jgi:hypothetical protein
MMNIKIYKVKFLKRGCNLATPLMQSDNNNRRNSLVAEKGRNISYLLAKSKVFTAYLDLAPAFFQRAFRFFRDGIEFV